MSELASMTCEACRRDSPPVTASERGELLPKIPDWSVVERDGVERLIREFSFPDFASALRFTNRVGGIAETAAHHPTILTEWGRVTVSWWTHKIRGLHLNDFILAARTDEVVEEH